MRVGVMGLHYGHIGGMFASAAKARDAELVGIVESDDALYAKYAADRRIPRFNTLADMLEEAEPELVLEGLDHNEKAPFVQAMIEALARGEEHLITTRDVLQVGKACILAEESAKQGGKYIEMQ